MWRRLSGACVREAARGLRAKRTLPPSVEVSRGAAQHLHNLVRAHGDADGVRISITNDWKSASGFSYLLSFVSAGHEAPAAGDERIALDSGTTVYIDRKALWAGEGGLLGAVIDVDDNMNIEVKSTKEADAERRR